MTADEKNKMKKVYLIGHGNLDENIFLELLVRNKVKTLIDVRSFPFSEYAGQFNRESLELLLDKNGIEYRHMGESLGGRTKGFEEYKKTKEYKDMKSSSQRFAWFKKYMKTEDFRKAVEDLKTVLNNTSAIMCSEADEERCHRKFIGLKLADEGFQVESIRERKTEKLDQKTILRFST